MRDDLLSAQASVDWVVTQLPAFQDRLVCWTRDNVQTSIRVLEPSSGQKIAVAQEKAALPPAFNVEAGAYINVIRSSLDILASTLSARNGKPDNRQAQFPIYQSAAHMLDPQKGLDTIWWLSEDQRVLIKSLEPYSGGNDTLRALHDLDIRRKHRRLLEVKLLPSTVFLIGIAPQHITWPAQQGIGANGETLLAFVSEDASPGGTVEAAFVVAFDEPGYLGSNWVVLALLQFTQTATSIIKLFDTP